jgi:hypothetical protein
MGDLVSLKLHRKRKARAAKEEAAAENRAAFGCAREERALTDARKAKAAKELDAHKRGE